jgi:hypothetical protein
MELTSRRKNKTGSSSSSTADVEENMLDVENFGKWVAKRNFKVENFFWKYLRNAQFGYPRLVYHTETLSKMHTN